MILDLLRGRKVIVASTASEASLANYTYITKDFRYMAMYVKLQIRDRPLIKHWGNSVSNMNGNSIVLSGNSQMNTWFSYIQNFD